MIIDRTKEGKDYKQFEVRTNHAIIDVFLNLAGNNTLEILLRSDEDLEIDFKTKRELQGQEIKVLEDQLIGNAGTKINIRARGKIANQ